MKNLFLLSVILFFSILIFGQTQEYDSLMMENISLMNKASSLNEYQTVANIFEMFSYSMPDRWLPYYYSSYCFVQMSFLVENKMKRDIFVKEAERLIAISDSLSPDNSEIYVLKGFILQAYMNIEPMTRGMKHNKECLNLFDKASTLNPNNPRSYLWHSVQLLNIPGFMGGGKEKASPYLESALEYFESFKPESDISPDWGYNYAKEKFKEIKDSKKEK